MAAGKAAEEAAEQGDGSDRCLAVGQAAADPILATSADIAELLLAAVEAAALLQLEGQNAEVAVMPDGEVLLHKRSCAADSVRESHFVDSHDFHFLDLT